MVIFLGIAITVYLFKTYVPVLFKSVWKMACTKRTRSGRVVIQPERYSPTDSVQDDYEDSEYNDSDEESDVSSQINYSEDEETETETEDEGETLSSCQSVMKRRPKKDDDDASLSDASWDPEVEEEVEEEGGDEDCTSDQEECTSDQEEEWDDEEDWESDGNADSEKNDAEESEA